MLITILIQLNFFIKLIKIISNHSKDLRNINLNDSEIQVEKKHQNYIYCSSEEKEGYRLNIDNQNYYLVKTNEFNWSNYENSNFE